MKGIYNKMDLKLTKEMFKKILLGLFITSAFACQVDPRISINVPGSPNLKPDVQQGIVAKNIVALLEDHHYKKVVVSDSLSSEIFDSYLKKLDPGRNYFLKSDIDDFEKYRFFFDDDLRKGDLSVPFYMFNVYLKRYNESVRFALSQVNNKFDFSTNEVLVYNREKMPWLAYKAESDGLWTKRVKYDLLNLRIARTDEAKNIDSVKNSSKDSKVPENSDAKNSETIKKRYENLLTQTAKTNNQDIFQILMRAFTESIDPHTNYFVPARAQDFNESLARTFEGIGARLQLENEVVKVIEIIPGGPAFKANNLHPSDRIIGVAQGKDGEFIDVIGWRIDATVSKIKGPKGTVVRLKIIPAGKELSSAPQIIEITRDKIVLEEQSAKKTIKTITEAGKKYKIGIIQLPAFYADWAAYQAGDPNYKSTTRDVHLLLDTLKNNKVDAVIIDLRSNGGGSLQEAVSLTGLFIKSGPVVQVRDVRNNVEVESDRNSTTEWNGPLGIIVDRFSASASEIFAGAIQDYGRGVIMGTQTYGKGTVQQQIDVSKLIGPVEKLRIAEGDKNEHVTISANAPQFGQINLTISKFYRISGSSTQHKGVMPDISFPMVYPADKYGESAQKSALPWDTIDPCKYTPFADLSTIKKQLVTSHDRRMHNSSEFKNLLDDIAQIKKSDTENSISLNEVQLKKERDEQEVKTLARTNQRRVARGLPPLKKGETDTKNKDDFDFTQDECMRVMADFIQFQK